MAMGGDVGCWMMDVWGEIWSARADQHPVGQQKDLMVMECRCPSPNVSMHLPMENTGEGRSLRHGTLVKSFYVVVHSIIATTRTAPGDL